MISAHLSSASGASGAPPKRCATIEFVLQAHSPFSTNHDIQGYDIDEEEIKMPLADFASKVTREDGEPECAAS